MTVSNRARLAELPRDIELLAAHFHALYQEEARRQGDVRHADEYGALPENVKEFDRILARPVLALLDALDEAEKALREVVECSDCGATGIASFLVNSVDSERIEWEPIYESRECGCRVAAREFLARIGDAE